MIDFIEPSKEFKPFKLSFWERTYGSEIPSFEFSRIRAFSEAKNSKCPNISGYVKKLGYGRFLLLPTLYTPMYIQCVCPLGVDVPPDNSYVNVEGISRWSKLKIAYDCSYGVDSEKEIVVEKWSYDSPDWIMKIKPNMEFSDFKEELFTRFSNIEPLLQDFIASQIVGCPSYEGFFGGISICLYDSTQNALAPVVAKEIKRIVPRDIGKPFVIKTGFGSVSLRACYNLITVNADTSLSTNVVNALENRKASIGCDELSVYFGSKKNLPKTLEDPPFQLSDFPTTLNEDADFIKMRTDPNLEVFKYMQIQHFINPIISDTSETIDKIHDLLIALPERYDVSSQLLSRFKILDASYYGKPQSVIRLALSNTRTENLEKMNDQNLNYALKLFEDNFDYNFELWRDMFPKETLPISTKLLLKLSPDERKILRIIEKLQSSNKSVHINEISDALPNMKKWMLEELLLQLANKRGLIIERHHQCYELIPFK